MGAGHGAACRAPAGGGCGCGGAAGGACGCRDREAAPRRRRAPRLPGATDGGVPSPAAAPRGGPYTQSAVDPAPRGVADASRRGMVDGAAAAKRQAWLDMELPELWPTLESLDEAGAERHALRLAALSPGARVVQERAVAPRGGPATVPMRGEVPAPPPVDCTEGSAPERFGLRSGAMRRGRWPKRPRREVTYMFPRLRGGMRVEDGDLLSGLRSLRGALARGLTPQLGRTDVRRPVMMPGPAPTPPPASLMGGVELLSERFFRDDLVELRGSAPTVRLQYRSTSIDLPTSWVMGYLREYLEVRDTLPPYATRGAVSGTGAVLDRYWPRFRGRLPSLPRRGSYGRLIGCWMLPYTADEGLPTSLFFRNAGEQRAVHELTCQLLEAYLPEAVVPRDSMTGVKLIDDDGWCDGLGNFIGDMLRGTERRSLRLYTERPEEDPDSLCGEARIHYTNKDGGLHGDERWSTPCVPGGALERWEGDCDDISFGCGSQKLARLLAWDDYVLEVRSVRFTGVGPSTAYRWLADVEAPLDSTSPWPRGDSPNTACNLGGLRSIQLLPAKLAFDAELVDLLLFMAQVCFDYSRALAFPGRPALGARVAEAGQAFAGYALSVLADRAAVLTHEFGHMYLGGVPHCGYLEGDGRPRWRSCFDAARRSMLARIVAENGLPFATYVAEKAVGAYSGTGWPLVGSTPDLATRWFYQLANPYWVDSSMGVPASCDSVPAGAEKEVDFWPSVNPGFAGCAGRFRVDLSVAGQVGGGYSTRSSNGCACSVPYVLGGFMGVVPSLDLTGGCYVAPWTVGVYSVPST